jgi:hypothetical protein
MLALWGFVMFLWIMGGTVTGIMAQNVTPGAPLPNATCAEQLDAGQEVNILLSADAIHFTRINLVIMKPQVPTINTCYVRAAFRAGTWNYAAFRDDTMLNLFRISGLMVFTAMVSLGMIVIVGPVLLQAVTTIRNLFRV